jgi:hypothetical protein
MKYRNPIYNRFGTINCEIEHPTYGWIPFTATPTDPEEYGRILYEEILAAGNIAPQVPISEEKLAAEARAERDRLLALSDWSQLPDVPQETKDLWAPYRQALRDIPQQPGFPTNIEWPQPPEQ